MANFSLFPQAATPLLLPVSSMWPDFFFCLLFARHTDVRTHTHTATLSLSLAAVGQFYLGQAAAAAPQNGQPPRRAENPEFSPSIPELRRTVRVCASGKTELFPSLLVCAHTHARTHTGWTFFFSARRRFFHLTLLLLLLLLL